MSLFQIKTGLFMRRKADNFHMDAFKVADFAPSVLADTAAGAVFEPFRTVLDTDEVMLRQAALIAAAAGCENLFHQPVATGAVAVGMGKEQLADLPVESFPSGKRRDFGIFA